MGKRPSAAQRGYGQAHQRLRKRVARAVAAGTAKCWRCGQPIAPDQPWDLGHDDRDRTIYRGPEHSGCNRATSSHRPPRRRKAEAHPGLVATRHPGGDPQRRSRPRPPG